MATKNELEALVAHLKRLHDEYETARSLKIEPARYLAMHRIYYQIEAVNVALIKARVQARDKQDA